MSALPSTLVLATHNKGKIAELKAMLAPLIADIRVAADFNLPEPEETGKTFSDNAILKARATAVATNLPALADDSGLAVHALGGEPGIYSARWAGPNKDFGAAMQKVRERLGNNPDRQAAFIAVLALVMPDGQVRTFEGRIDGTLVWPPRGTGGFGYDPMFLPKGQEQTFGEMDKAFKNVLSHRSRAVRKLLDYLEAAGGGATG